MKMKKIILFILSVIMFMVAIDVCLNSKAYAGQVVEINGDASYTNIRTVKIKLTYDGYSNLNNAWWFRAGETQASVDSSTAVSLPLQYASPTASSYEFNLTLSEGDGDKTVYVKFGRTNKWGTSYEPVAGTYYFDTIVLDTTAPSVTFGTSGSNIPSQSQSTIVSVSDATGLSLGYPKYQWTTSRLFPTSGTWTSFTSGNTLMQSGGNGDYYLHIHAIDALGNEVKRTSNKFALDNTSPSVPTASPPGGTYNLNQNVTLGSIDSGVTIRYTTNGTDPTAASAAYSTAISVSSTMIIKAKAWDAAGNVSSVITQMYTLDKTAPIASNIHLENVTEKGFDIVLDISDTESGVNLVRLPVWRNGNYNGMITKDFWNQGNGNGKRYRVDMSEIGAGADSIYVGVHLQDYAGNYKFFGDYGFKLDTLAPELIIYQPDTALANASTTIKATVSDNFNAVEKISITGPDLNKTTTNIYSKPKILSLASQDGNRIILGELISLGYDITTKANITSVDDFAGYDIIFYDGSWGSADSKAAYLNQAFDQGYKIFTLGNDTAGGSGGIRPISAVTYKASPTYGFKQAINNVTDSKYTLGDYDNIMKYYDGTTEGDSSSNYVIGWSSGTRPISLNTTDTGTANILYSINNNGGKWIHGQFYNKHGVTRSIIDELMIGTTIPQEHLSDLHGWNSTDGNNSYAVLQPDGFYRVNRKNASTGRVNQEILMDKRYPVSAGQVWTESFYFKSNGTTNNFSITVFTNNGHHTIVPTITDMGNGLKRAAATYTVEAGAIEIRAIDIILGSENWDYIDIKGVQLEKRNTATSYTKDFTVYQNGTYTIETEDFFGNISARTITVSNIDNMPPTGGSILINNGAMYAGSLPLELRLGATDATKMFISKSSIPPTANSPNVPGVSTGWVNYITSYGWDSVTSASVVTLNIWYKDDAGNISNMTSDSITYDNQAPTGTVTINGGVPTTYGQTVKLYILGDDGHIGSGITHISVSENPLTVSWELYSSLYKDFTLSMQEGEKTVYVKFKDVVGNESIPVSAKITYIAPTYFFDSVEHNQIIKVGNKDVMVTDPVTLAPGEAVPAGYSINDWNKFIDGDYLIYRLVLNINDTNKVKQVQDMRIEMHLNDTGEDGIALNIDTIQLKKDNTHIKNLKPSLASLNTNGVSRYNIIRLGKDTDGQSIMPKYGAGQYAIEYAVRLKVRDDYTDNILDIVNDAIVKIYTGSDGFPDITEPDKTTHKTSIVSKVLRKNVITQ